MFSSRMIHHGAEPHAKGEARGIHEEALSKGLSSGHCGPVPAGVRAAARAQQALPTAPAILFDLHGELLRLLACRSGRHFQGLAQAGRSLRLASKTRKRLERLDGTVAFLRHITSPRAQEFVLEVEMALASIEDGWHENNSDNKSIQQVIGDLDKQHTHLMLQLDTFDDGRSEDDSLPLSQPVQIVFPEVPSFPSILTEPPAMERMSSDALSDSEAAVERSALSKSEDGGLPASQDLSQQVLTSEVAVTLINDQIAELLRIVTTSRARGASTDSMAMKAARKQIEELRAFRNNVGNVKITVNELLSSTRRICSFAATSSSSGA